MSKMTTAHRRRPASVAGHERKAKWPGDGADESALFFDERKVPVEVIHVPNPDMELLKPDMPLYRQYRRLRDSGINPCPMRGAFAQGSV